MVIAGVNGFPFWEYSRPEYDLANLFPGDPAMPLVNKIVSKSIVREQGDCATTTAVLESFVDEAIAGIRNLDRRTRNDAEWLCLICKKGHYGLRKLGWRPRDFFVINKNETAHIGDLTAYFCDHGGHVQLFEHKWD